MALHSGEPSQNPALRVGVTGGIGSGKSTVCGILASLGRYVLRADELARDLTDTLPVIQSAIKSHFGNEVFLPDGSLDRRKLASIVFANPARRATLDTIIHPHVFNAIDIELAKLSSAQQLPYVAIEAALVFETGMDERLNYVIVVQADEETRIRRVMERDKISRDEVLMRLRSQMDQSEKVSRADFVIENDGSEEELRRRVMFVDRILTLIAQENKSSRGSRRA